MGCLPVRIKRYNIDILLDDEALQSSWRIPATEEMKIMLPLTLRMCGRASLVRAIGAKKLTVNMFCVKLSGVETTGCSALVYPALLIRTSNPINNFYFSTINNITCEINSDTLTSKLVDGLLNDGRARF